jgi:hypothetical protein
MPTALLDDFGLHDGEQEDIVGFVPQTCDFHASDPQQRLSLQHLLVSLEMTLNKSS